MENTWSWDNTAVDYTLLEKVNPVFNTAKMTLFQLAANGDRDAAALAKSMGLTLEATQNSANTKASPEQVLGGTIMLEARYRTMASLAEKSGYTLVDMPCGYTPRAIEFARKGLPYYGLDLPVVVREASEKILALGPADVLYRFGGRGALRQYPPHIGKKGRLLVHGRRGMLSSVCSRHARAGG